VRILLAGNQERGLRCLQAVAAAGHEIIGVVAHPEASARGGVAEEGARIGAPVWRPEDVNDAAVVAELAATRPDVFVLAGYGQVLRGPLVTLGRYGCVNLHGGRLPQYRGSSPMNWALINGDDEVTISAIAIDAGIDTGDVLGERTFSVREDDSIAEVQARANELFPELLLDVLAGLDDATLERRPQNEADARYWTLRFPDDGLVVWDQLTAGQVHNRVRALAPPYPGAFTLWRGRRVRLLRSTLEGRVVVGEPGRVYAVGPSGILVGALDRCIRITEAVIDDDASDFSAVVPRYDQLVTVRSLLLGAS
jgi:methionyl-tRNA formyltransferase